MNMIMIPIIFMIILLILFMVFLIVTKRQDATLKTIDKEGKIKSDPPKTEVPKKATSTTSVSTSASAEKKTEVYKKEDVFKFMEFDRILDKMIVQNGGSRFTMAIRCKGINYDLMSEVEQLSVEEGFITFLNTLKYPIQLYVQAQNIDLKGNVAKYKNNIEELTKDYNEINEKYNKLASAFDVDERELENVTKERDRITNVYEYAHDIIKYVEKMSTNKSLLQRKFYVLLSYNTSEINAVDKFSKDEVVEMCSTELMTRCKGIISALSSCSVSGEILDSNELADLLYSAYNRDDKSLMSVREAIESGMLRLYSTSEDAFERKEEKLEEYLRNQAQLRAYQAIKYAKEHDEIETPASQILDREEEISRRATNYVKNSDYAPDEKERASKKILTDYREVKKELSEIHEIQKEEILKEADKDIAKIPELEKTEVPYGVQLIEKSKKIKVDALGNIVEDNKKEEITEDSEENKKKIEEVKTETKEIIDNNSEEKNTNAGMKAENESNDVNNIYATEDDEDDESII